MKKNNILRSYVLTLLQSVEVRKVATLSLLILFHCVVYGQKTTHEEPISFKKDIPQLTINEQTHKIMPFLDMEKIEQEDKEDEASGIIPRFGYSHEVNYNLDNSGEWIALPDGDKIWRLSISCPEATSINLLYDRFWLPEGAKYFIHSNDYQSHLGAFTSKNNRGNKEDMREFSTGLLRSDHITLEYYLPKEVKEIGFISISHVVHGYKSINSSNGPSKGYGDSWSGHSNVNCKPDWKDEKDAVVMIIAAGNRHCSGALVNTTAEGDHNRHFILLAMHCLSVNAHTYKVGDSLNNWQFCWHYESPGCNNPSNEPPLIWTQGAKVVVKSQVNFTTFDIALLELYEDPSEAWDVIPYFSGWDRSNAQTLGNVIHHPQSDIKKIATDLYLFPAAPDVPKHSWRHSSTFGRTMEPGSSGSPMFNSNHKLIGVHSKSLSMQGGAYYFFDLSKFGSAWNGVGPNLDSTQRVKDWLDPLNTDTTAINGRRACQNTIKLHYSFPKPAYHAVDSIISKQVINNGTVSYKAGIEIVLKDGFHAKSGSNLTAQIEPLDCNATQSISFSPIRDESPNDIIIENLNFSLSQPQIPYQINLLPNPNNGSFHIETNFPLTDIAHLKITNLLGVTVYETKNLTSNTIQLQNAAAGLYFVVMILKDGSVLTQKMVVQR
jgi:hypothetical protein